MKKITLVLSLFSLSLFMVACGATDDNNTTENDQVVEENNDQTTNDTNQEGTNTNDSNADNTTSNNGDDEAVKMESLDYKDFSLSVDYGSNEEYEAELELNRDNRVEAKIEDDMKGVKIKGTEAFNELYPLVEQLTITQDTTRDEAIQEVLEVFNLADNYLEFEMEIEFKEGTKIEFEDQK